ncbi:MAG TPA: transcriptional regulator [Gammaproteobacteria bacterium]|nr:transcriptional regulator [Gammaproteobacteria bacterium]
MNIQQLRIIREAVRRSYNLREVAAALFTSQSGVSRHIKDFEDELGVTLFVRKGKRLLGLTEPGDQVFGIAAKVLTELDQIRSLCDQFSSGDSGRLRIATTHTQARYVLPAVITEFRRQFPRVHVVLLQGSPSHCAEMLLSGDADVAVASEVLRSQTGIAGFEFYRWHHAVVVPRGHALDDEDPLTLGRLASHPILTYHDGFTGRHQIDEAFSNQGLQPEIAISALDADVIKTYVGLGMGVGIIASMAFEAGRELSLRQRSAEHMFGSCAAHVGVRRGAYLRGYVYRFLEICIPALTERVARRIVSSVEPGLALAEND